jgi:hypothetical protein
VDIRQATGDPGEQIQNSFLFGHHANPELALHDAELQRVSWIAVAMLATMAVAFVVSWRRRTLPGARNWWLPLALIPAGVLVLLLPVSLLVWNVLPKMQFLQFPWRWLVVLEAPLGIFVAAAVERQGQRYKGTEGQEGPGSGSSRAWIVPAMFGVLFAGLTVFAGRMFFEECDPYDAIPGMLQDYRAGDGFQGTDEYAPVDADDLMTSENLPAACLVADPAAVLGKSTADNPQPSWAADQKSCLSVLPNVEAADAMRWSARGSLPQSGFLVLRLRRYPSWDLKVNGHRVADTGHRADGLMVVPVGSGLVNVRADWQTTPDARWGGWISLAALALLVALGLVTGLGAPPRRRSQPRIE